MCQNNQTHEIEIDRIELFERLHEIDQSVALTSQTEAFLVPVAKGLADVYQNHVLDRETHGLYPVVTTDLLEVLCNEIAARMLEGPAYLPGDPVAEAVHGKIVDRLWQGISALTD